MTSQSRDLIEIHVHGGPWTQEQAEIISKRLAGAVRRYAQGYESRRAWNVENVYVADIRGEQDGDANE